jgi:cell division protein FtsQ
MKIPPRAMYILIPLLLIALLGVLSLFYPKIEPQTIRITGLKHLERDVVLGKMGLLTPRAWLWYGTKDVQNLLQEPWIAEAKVVKRFPNRLEITLTERVAFARFKNPNGESVVARDGITLPNATPSGALISGWGQDRRLEALEVIATLSGYQVTAVVYSPSGLRISTEQGSLWCESLDSLYKYARKVTGLKDQMTDTQSRNSRTKQINIYPWGVSVTQ